MVIFIKLIICFLLSNIHIGKIYIQILIGLGGMFGENLTYYAKDKNQDLLKIAAES